MEFVAGKTLASWMRGRSAAAADGRPRSSRVFIAAGQGLAAAHAPAWSTATSSPRTCCRQRRLGPGRRLWARAALVRRRAARRREPRRPRAPSRWTRRTREHRQHARALARHVADADRRVMGTPAYMAPEQHLRRGRDAAQRSVRVLRRAVGGALRPAPVRRPRPDHPLARGHQRRHGRAAERWPQRAPPGPRACPPGAAERPRDRSRSRFANIDALLVALAHDPNRRRRRITKIVALNLLGAVGVFAAGMWVADYLWRARAAADRLRAGRRCSRDLGSSAARAGGRALRPRSTRRLPSTPPARSSAASTPTPSQWIAAWGETCEAAAQRLERALELQRECLELRRRELEAFSAALISTSTMNSGSGPSTRWPRPRACRRSRPAADPSRLRADPHLNPEQRERVARLQTRPERSADDGPARRSHGRARRGPAKSSPTPASSTASAC